MKNAKKSIYVIIDRFTFAKSKSYTLKKMLIQDTRLLYFICRR